MSSQTFAISTWAIAPLSLVLREHKDADHIRLAMRRNGPRVEWIHIEAVYNDGSVVETGVYEAEDGSKVTPPFRGLRREPPKT